LADLLLDRRDLPRADDGGGERDVLHSKHHPGQPGPIHLFIPPTLFGALWNVRHGDIKATAAR
jgi:hypothetical protein